MTNEELFSIKGGTNWLAAGIGSTLVSFLIGLIDGFIRPLKCNYGTTRTDYD